MKKPIITLALLAASTTTFAGGSNSNATSLNHTLNDALSVSSVDSHDDNRNYIKNPDIPVHSAIAPGLVTGGNDMCVGSTSVAAQTMMVGASAAWTRESENCNRRKDAAIWFNMGYKMKDIRMVQAGIARLCQGGGNAEAASAAGIDCGQPAVIPPVDIHVDKREPVNGKVSRNSFKTGIQSFDNRSYN